MNIIHKFLTAYTNMNIFHKEYYQIYSNIRIFATLCSQVTLQTTYRLDPLQICETLLTEIHQIWQSPDALLTIGVFSQLTAKSLSRHPNFHLRKPKQDSSADKRYQTLPKWAVPIYLSSSQDLSSQKSWLQEIIQHIFHIPSI